MASKGISTLKFVGSISLGLLTGLSYTLSTLTLPTLLTLPSASTASRAFTNLTAASLTHVRVLAGISSSSFLLAYLLSPRSQRHPYLLWTTLFVASSGLSDLVLGATRPKITAGNSPARRRDRQHRDRQMDASYEVLGASDRESDATASGEETGDDVNGEEVRGQMEGFMTSQTARTLIAGVGFALSVVGIWGDGAADVVVIEM